MIQKQSGITNNKNFLRHRFSCYYDYKISRFDIIIIIINHTMKFLSICWFMSGIVMLIYFTYKLILSIVSIRWKLGKEEKIYFK